jgi:large subunit ribosomal protein L10
MIMVSERKKKDVHELVEQIERYPVVGILDMHKLPARQLYMIKQQLKGKAVIRMAKKRVTKLALGKSKKPDISKLGDSIQNQPALLFSEGNPFELANTISKSVTNASAKAGDIAPRDIIVPAGPTNLPPGPAIGELQKAKIPAGVEGDKIVVKRDTCIVKEGEEISAGVADIMGKLGIEPMKISLNLIAVWDEGMVFGKDLLFIPREHYIGQLQSAYSNAFSMCMNIGYVTPETITLLLSKAHREAYALALEAGIVTPENVGQLLAKADAQAKALSGLVKEDVPVESPEEPKEGEAAKKEEKPEEKVEPGGEHGEPEEEGKKG